MVHFYVDKSKIPDFIKFDFLYDKLQIPTIGEAATPLTTSISQEAIRYPYSAIISADFSFPAQEFYAQPITTDRKLTIPTENVTTRSTITLIIQDPKNAVDIVNEFWDKLGGVINFLYLAGGAAVTWFVGRYLNKRNKK